jgi:adenosylcobinamide kinase / adenosylcobinamide-phosphate guanylyltransferase
MGNITLILGGARSGKSSLAERLAAKRGERVIYVATAQSLDEEMSARIQAHKQKRLPHWQTLEIPTGVGQALMSQTSRADVILLDCITLMVSNLIMEASPNVDEPDEKASAARVEAEISQLLAAIQNGAADWIIVSNEVGMGLVPPYPLGRIYRDLLGWANQRLASKADEVYLMVAGIPMQLTPAAPSTPKP